MELEKQTLAALIRHLQEHGYPPDSFAVEFPIGKYCADLAVIDPDAEEPIALFEIKQDRSPAIEEMGRRQLERFVSVLDAKSIPMYLVFGREGSPPFEIDRFSPAETIAVESKVQPTREKILDFEILRRSGYNLVVKAKKDVRNRQVDRFMAVCLILGAFVLALFFADISGRISISATRLTLLVIFVGLVLTPYASKIKFALLEFERLRKEGKPSKQ